MTNKLTGQINEGWLGEDRSTEERKKGGTEYVMDVAIGHSCSFRFEVTARSLDEAKDIVRTLLQWSVNWDEAPSTLLESFFYDTVPVSHRALLPVSKAWLASYAEKYGEEAVKGAIRTANKRIEFAPTLCDGDTLVKYISGILRNNNPTKGAPVVIKGKMGAEHSY